MTNPLLQEIPLPTTCAAWQRHYRASQRMLTRALRENRVRDECLEIAKRALGHLSARHDNYASDALAEIHSLMAQLEPEEEAGNADEAAP